MNLSSSPYSRRSAIRSLLGGSLVFPGVLSELLAESPVQNALSPRQPHFAPKAKRVIWIYLTGGFSHLDSFDPKPKLHELANAPGGQDSKKKQRYLPSQWDYRRHGQSGMEISDLFPHIARRADDLCLIRSLHSSHGNHQRATLGMHTGSFTVTRPSIGSWVSYGLGTLNQNLPSFVVLAPKLPYSGALPWGADFLPRQHQGTRVVPSKDPVPNLQALTPTSTLQEMELGLLKEYNERHLNDRPGASELASRMQTFETAFGMQMEMPGVLDLSTESDATHALYGLERGSTKGFAWQCLVARRLAESGVRFIELIDTGSSANWDAHGDIKGHARLAKNVDQPVAALLEDLKLRGMLEDTLVVFTTEFGRRAVLEGKNGRGHHPHVFSSWLAGGGTKAGHVHGSSDETGEKVAAGGVHVHDFHATILHLLGFDHTQLTHRHAGRDFRLTDIHGEVVNGLIA